MWCMRILLPMVLNAAYMLWCMHVSIILWSVLHKQTLCVLGPLILEKHLFEGWNFHEILEALCCADLASNFDIFGWNWHWNPNTISKHQTSMTQTVSREGPKRRKCRRHIWSWVMCCDFFFTFMDRIFVNGSKTPRIVMPGSYIWVNYNDLTATSVESWLIREIIPKWP